jgi:hypothetical protein
MKSLLIALAFGLAACNGSTPPATTETSSRPPTDQEIEAYLNNKKATEREAAKREDDDKQAEGRRNRHLADIYHEREALQGYISVKQVELNREQTRLLRKYVDDTVQVWTANIARYERRIKAIDKELDGWEPPSIKF